MHAERFVSITGAAGSTVYVKIERDASRGADKYRATSTKPETEVIAELAHSESVEAAAETLRKARAAQEASQDAEAERVRVAAALSMSTAPPPGLAAAVEGRG